MLTAAVILLGVGLAIRSIQAERAAQRMADSDAADLAEIRVQMAELSRAVQGKDIVAQMMERRAAGDDEQPSGGAGRHLRLLPVGSLQRFVGEYSEGVDG